MKSESQAKIVTSLALSHNMEQHTESQSNTGSAQITKQWLTTLVAGWLTVRVAIGIEWIFQWEPKSTQCI